MFLKGSRTLSQFLPWDCVTLLLFMGKRPGRPILPDNITGETWSMVCVDSLRRTRRNVWITGQHKRCRCSIQQFMSFAKLFGENRMDVILKILSPSNSALRVEKCFLKSSAVSHRSKLSVGMCWNSNQFLCRVAVAYVKHSVALCSDENRVVSKKHMKISLEKELFSDLSAIQS